MWRLSSRRHGRFVQLLVEEACRAHKGAFLVHFRGVTYIKCEFVVQHNYQILNIRNRSFCAMERYEKTRLWRVSLGEESPIGKEDRERLSTVLRTFRSRAAVIAADLASHLPGYTTHDETHFDALWEMADLITGSEVSLTPLEGFVLGGAILAHDLGNCLASYPRGLDELKNTDVYQDALFSTIKKRLGTRPSTHDIEAAPLEDIREATATALRLLHAKHAEDLPFACWSAGDKDEDFYLITDEELRLQYGRLIGQIAYSHWWDAEKVFGFFNSEFGAPGFMPEAGTINALKIALILRLSDACHLDSRRAPSFLKAVRKPQGDSALHWSFQERLGVPTVHGKKLRFSTPRPFKSDESEAWWLCFDTLTWVSRELKKVDGLSLAAGKPQFLVDGIEEIDTPERFSKLVCIEGWKPIDTHLRVSDVSRLISTLGGEALYGLVGDIPLRELLQNAFDSIRARRIVDNRHSTWGEVTLRLGHNGTQSYVEVSDTGVGMSETVLTKALLDFGYSYWSSPNVMQDFPGLVRKGFSPTGRFGIGFYSVFMWCDKVSVVSRRYELGRDKTLVLDFENSVYSRPVLREATSEEAERVRDGGTSIRAWVKPEFWDSDSNHPACFKEKSPECYLAWLCPTSEVNLSVIEGNGAQKQVIAANDWLTIPGEQLVRRVAGVQIPSESAERSAKFLSLVQEDGFFSGRVGVSSKSNLLPTGVITVGGIRTGKLSSLAGVLLGTNTEASRTHAVPVSGKDALARWAEDEEKLLHDAGVTGADGIHYSALLRSFGCLPTKLEVVQVSDGFLDAEGFMRYVADRTHINLAGRELVEETGVLTRDLELDADTVLIPLFRPQFLEGASPALETWPATSFFAKEHDCGRWWDFNSSLLTGVLVELVAKAWACSVKEILSSSDIDQWINRQVGMRAGQRVMAPTIQFNRPVRG